jgi:aldehyde dehydrogenase (NAD+)
LTEGHEVTEAKERIGVPGDWDTITTGLPHLIDGELVRGEGSFFIVSPWTGRVLAETPVAQPDEVERSLAAARRAFDDGPWPRMRPSERARILRDFAGCLASRRAELVSIAIHQTGAVRSLAEAVQVGSALEAAYRYADAAADLHEIDTMTVTGAPMSGQSAPRMTRLVQRVPAGVVSAITPFNYPLRVNIQKVFPALAVGCTVILKPHPTTSWDAAIMAQAAAEAGIPAGVLNILLGGVPKIGEAMVADARVDMISFTGSTATGRRIMALASDTIKNIVLELGGKSANIVCADADLDAFFSSDPANLRHAGQGCGQLTRAVVETPVYDEVVERLAARMRIIRFGAPEELSTELGPLANAAQYERVLEYIRIGVEEGARLVTGGGRPASAVGGYFVEPTLFADVRNDMRIAQEEIFGPVLVVIPFDGERQAVQITEDSIYGINASVWSRDTDKAWRIARAIRTGNVGINCLANVTAGPHGGFKQTGIGREWGKWSLDEYVELRAFEYLG